MGEAVPRAARRKPGDAVWGAGPRPLCRVADRSDSYDAARVEVRVSACPASSVDGPAPALIIVHGGLDTYCVNRIGAAVREFVSFASDVVVDLASVRTIDSGGVAFIESLHGAITQRGGSLTIHDPNITVERILQICGIDAAIPVCRPT